MKGRATNIGGVDEKSDDDNVFEDSEEENNNDIINPNKRNRSDDDEDDYCLEDDDYDLLEENLGVKIQRKKYKRLRTIQADDSDGDDRDAIANQLFNNDKKQQKKSIFDVYDPCELHEGYFTDIDQTIRCTDIPERMQLRSVPITPVDKYSNELDLESKWIYQHAFKKPTISIQDDIKKYTLKGPKTIEKIKNALNFIRNESLEVPYIAYYKKDYVLPELDQNDLWRVYKFDAKWSQLCQRKNSLLKLYSNMYEYQQVQVKINSKYSLFDNIRMINVSDLNRLKNVETNEELNDIHQHFSLYYNYDIPAMQELIKRRKVKEKYLDKLRNQQVPNNVDENNMEIDIDIEVEESNNNHLKQRAHSGPYSLYRKAGLDSFAKKFGLTPEEFAENLNNNYQNNKIKQEINEPSVIANNYFKNTTSSTDEIINAVKHMVAIQLSREPLLRKCVRKIYMEHAKITVKPTKTGIKMIDESHPIFTMMYLKDKPINTLIDDQFLKLIIAEQDKLITIKISDTIEGYTSDNYVDDVKKLYVNNDDELDDCIENWNNLRQASVEMALNDIVIPSLKNELKSVLIDEAKEHVMRACCKKLYDWIKIAPYKCDNSIFDGDDWDTSCGLRVMTISYVPDQTQAGFACIVTPNGDCTDYLKLPHVLKREDTWRYIHQKAKKNELMEICNFILIKKPHVIAISGESVEANHIFEDIKKCVTSLMQSNDDFPDVPIEIYDNHLSKLYSNSTIGKMEFNNYNEILREAISLARYIQDPLREFSRFCTKDEEILFPYYHPLQKQLSKDELIENLYIEFINRVNEVGVDINEILKRKYNDNLLQFICGLGPRKSTNIIKILKNSNKYLENRPQLMTLCQCDEIVYKNCCGFIKIDPDNINYDTDNFIEILDSSRIHPDDYDFARRMALDILEYDDENATKALEEILDKPNILEDLDLDTYAEQIVDESGEKRLTLEDIRTELHGFFKDLRVPYEKPDSQQLFELLTKETQDTFYVGKKIDGFIIKINKKKPIEERRDEIHPVRNNDTRLWKCSYCNKDDFIELSHVWNHLDNEECTGKLTGIKIKFDNGITGYIKIKNMSDDNTTDIPDNIQINTPIKSRIISINIDKFNVECSIKKSDLDDIDNVWSLKKDDYYDNEQEKIDLDIVKSEKIQQNLRVYHIRIITNKYFKNVNYPETENIMKHHSTKQGDAVIRPSSKGCDHLTITWKVTDNVFHHIDIREEDKPNSFSVGRRLFIGEQEFDDLYEIMTNYVKPLAENAATIINYKYYKSSVLGSQVKADNILKKQQIINPKYIPYILSVFERIPTYFMLSYLPHNKVYHEYIQITSNGFIYREKEFKNFQKLLRWFKEYYNKQTNLSHELRGLCNVKNKNLINQINEKMSDTSIKSLSSLINQSPINYPSYKPAAVTGYSGTNKYIDDLFTTVDETPTIKNNQNNKAAKHSLFDPDFW
ncbi:hypothetical protein HCN44_000535 [Aphidius gifuensis]|uniref:Transcription elongation factor spt6 n=1 Tax=Aphidius gifuensis TaxID=684658 RepID=A0A834XS15_APHGI|nr:hypothetical protein HCN44_000535 [Aphidius gifuensis]